MDHDLLERLDQWQRRRLRQGFTPELAAQALAEFMQSARHSSVPIPEETQRALAERFSPDAVLAWMGEYYTSAFPRLETSLQKLSIHTHRAVVADYIQPIREAEEPLYRFVEQITAAGLPPSTLSDSTIDRHFRRIFPDAQTYAAFLRRRDEAVAALTAIKVRDVADKELNDTMRAGNLANIALAPYIAKAFFHD